MPTCHVITVHYRSERWIGPQLRGLRAHLSEKTRLYGVLNDVPRHRADAFDWSADLEGTHAQKLNEVAAMICRDAPADDYLMFLDGDAFPVAPITPALLAGRRLAAVRRDENAGDPQPHPCFCFTTVGLWREIGGDWMAGPTWTNRRGKEVSDVGATLWRQLADRGLDWTPLLRSSEHGSHPVFFGVYGGVIYHHGAGFRTGLSRALRPESRPVLPTWVPVLARVEREVRERRRASRVRALQQEIDATSAALRARIDADPEFFASFIPVPSVSPP